MDSNVLFIFVFFFAFAYIASAASASSAVACTGSGSGNVVCGNVIVSNATIDTGQWTFIEMNGISGGILPWTANVLFSSSNIPAANTLPFTFENSANTITFGINAFQANQLLISSYNGLATSANLMGSDILVFNSLSSLTSNTLWGRISTRP